MRFLSPMLRRCAKATANRTAQASPDVAVRKLNGGISSSAIFMIGQVRPHARLSATSISRATASELVREDGRGTNRDPERGDGEARLSIISAARSGRVFALEYCSPAGRLVMLHRSLPCVTEPRVFRGATKGRVGALREMQSPIAFQGLGAHRPRRCRAGGIASRSKRSRTRPDVAGEGAIVSGMAGRYATALFELALENNAIDAAKADLDRFDALVAESPDLT